MRVNALIAHGSIKVGVLWNIGAPALDNAQPILTQREAEGLVILKQRCIRKCLGLEVRGERC